MIRLLNSLGLIFHLLLAPVQADDVTSPVDYTTHVKPLLESKCYSCHGVLKQEGGLRLDTRSLMLDGGDSGAAMTPGDARTSVIIERITADRDTRMPPDGEGAALKADEVAILSEWINRGAVAPDESAAASPLEHWAFRPVQRPQVPSETNGKSNPIDSLIHSKLRQHHLQAQQPAPRSILLRRLYLDLIGLPPSLSQLEDPRPLEEIADDLLASPHHGERWGRHWMDVWRYSDWYGLGAQLRYSQKHIWHWRDWIIDSLNADKGYDRMIQEMLAGDELDPANPDVVVGTGFLARNYYLFNRTTWLDSTIEHTGKAFLGLTLNCSKCHDHKYDPFPQTDYYNLRAVFEPHQVRLDPVPGTTDLEKDGLPRVFDDHINAPTWLHRKGDPGNPDKDVPIQPQVPEIFRNFQPEITPVSLPASAYAPGVRDYVQRDHLQVAQKAVEDATAEVTLAKKRLSAINNPGRSNAVTADTELFKVTDSFDGPNPELWELTGSNWKYENGQLVQTVATRDKEFARLREPLPKDFELSCRYTTTGGTTYKSVTFRFDESDDSRFANFVYTSAHEPGPKVQVAFTRDGNHSYPPEGRVSKPIQIGQVYTLRFAVKDRLVNVWLDGKFAVAFRFPDRRPKGRLTLSGFDATVAFDSISLSSLSPDTQLTEPGNSAPDSPQDAAAAVNMAEARLAAANAELKALQAVIAADKARYLSPGSNDVEQLTRQAARLQAEAELAQANVEKLTANSDAEKLKTASAKVEKATIKLMEAQNGAGTYRSIRASRKALEGPADKESDYASVYTAESTGRRLAFARWVTSTQNPLTARVAVNHVWMRHFGTPLVESVFDFGLRTKQPLHADILDYLAAEFMESGWSFKHLHRLIVSSETYQQCSTTLYADPATLAGDQGNQFYWRMNTRRMESQIVRDSLLTLAGTLDTTMGGPSVKVGSDSKRRSIYFQHSRDQQDKFLSMFDDADLLQCYRRSESIVPQQALALANSSLSMTMAQQISSRITTDHPKVDRDQFITLAFQTILAREGTDKEVSECRTFCTQLNQLLTANSVAEQTKLEPTIRTRLIHSLLNHNDFITIR